jgi:hypothetical protein
VEYVCYYDNWYITKNKKIVGYGDYFPVTNFGRVIIMIAAFTGIIFVSLIIISLQSYINLRDHESKVFDFVDRLAAKDEIKKEAASYFHRTFKYFLKKKQYLKKINDGRMSQKEMEIYKEDLIQNLYEKIKVKKQFKTTLQ